MQSGIYRKQPRNALKPLTSPISVLVQGQGRNDLCTLEKLSVGGAFISLSDPPGYGEPVKLIVGGGPQAFEVRGIVRWVEHTGFGVQFNATGARETAALARLVLAA